METFKLASQGALLGGLIAVPLILITVWAAAAGHGT